MSIGVAQAYTQAGMLDKVTFSPGDEYNGWLKWLVQNSGKNTGVVTFPPEAGAVGVRVMTKILRGQTVKRGVRVPSRYIAPSKVRKYAQMSAPDDWWATELPRKWQPKP
jgi:ABC-type sugar transport system substrate-binding protein